MKYRLGDICIIQSGGTPNRSNPDFYNSAFIPWAKVGDLDQGDIINKTEESISEKGLQSIGNRVFESGTLLLAMYGSVGKTAIAGMKLSCNQAIVGIDVIDRNNFSNEYLKYWFDYHKAHLIFKSKGGILKNLTSTYVKDLIIEIPSFEEQLNAIKFLKIARNVIDKRKQTLVDLESYVHSIFVNRFGDPFYNPKRYPYLKLKDVVKSDTVITYGIVQAGPEIENGVPYIRSGDLKNGTIKINNLKRTSKQISDKYSRSQCSGGDIIMSIRATVGSVAILPDELEGANLTQGTARIAADPEIVNKYYLFELFSLKGGQALVKQFQKGSTFKEITLAKLREVTIPIAPLQEQIEFSLFFQSVNLQKDYINRSLKLMEDLFETLIFKLFGNVEPDGKDEIDELMDDDIELELFLNTIKSSDYENEDLYDIDIKRLHKILDRTKEKNENDSQYLKGLVQRFEEGCIILETNKEHKYRLSDEVSKN